MAAKQGQLIRTQNTQRKTLKSGHVTGAKEHIYVWVDDNGEEYPLALTEHQHKVARERAAKNPEDVPAKGFIQGILDKLD
jgi:hypothetical protein